MLKNSLSQALSLGRTHMLKGVSERIRRILNRENIKWSFKPLLKYIG